MNAFDLTPDELLKIAEKEEKKSGAGKLKIFFGMSAGVGKTYSMLQAAQAKKQDGVNVVIGTINTHGRVETEKLTQGLPTIPEKWVTYKDTVFSELDLEAILTAKPTIVLIDELAHTNVPGSKHSKRWQDVLEILDNGIDVYSTLNVQHLESRKDMVESITGITIRETVPDIIIEKADSIELIDISPEDLLKRLKEGKVYLGEQSKIATENFFKEELLTALREIALRFTAEKVEHDLHGLYAKAKGWSTREKILVAVSPHAYSEILIRTARRRAFEMDCTWTVLYVETSETLSDEDQLRLSKHLNLSRDLGAEVITTQDPNIVEGIRRVALQKKASQIILGRPFRKRWFFEPRLLLQLQAKLKQCDITVIRQDKPTEKVSKPIKIKNMNEYLFVILTTALMTLLGILSGPFIGYKSVGFIYLLGIISLSYFVGFRPILLAAFLSALSWDFLFIPPYEHLHPYESEDIILVILYFLVSIVIGRFTTRLREQEKLLKIREAKLEKLYDIEKAISKSPDFDHLREQISSLLSSTFSGKFDILSITLEGKLSMQTKLSLFGDEKERACAEWSFEKGKISGRSTDTLPSSLGTYFPIKTAKIKLGILVCQSVKEKPFSLEQTQFLQTVSSLLVPPLERYLYESREKYQLYVSHIEKLQTSFVKSVTSGFEILLNKLKEAQTKLESLYPAFYGKVYIKEMEDIHDQLKFIIEHILSTSEIESGFLRLEKKKYNVKHFIDDVVNELKPFFEGKKLVTRFPSGQFFALFDYKLLKTAFQNAIMNEMERSKSETILEFKDGREMLSFILYDDGPQIPEEEIPSLYEKTRPAGKTFKGLGLGLSVTKSIIDIHQGTMEIKAHDKSGMEISIRLPGI